MTYPFPVKDLVVLDDALKFGSRAAKARFAVYLGDLGADTAATAREILAKVPTPDNAVLLAVSPNQRAIEVVYGRTSRAAASKRPRRWGLGGRRVIQGRQPDGRSDQRRARAERRRLAALIRLPRACAAEIGDMRLPGPGLGSSAMHSTDSPGINACRS